MKLTLPQLHWQILIAIVLAGIAGQLAGETATIGSVSWYAIFDFFGTMFINALKMLIVPLIASSIIVGVACSGSSTPPIPVPPDRCTFLPIWAQLPTVAQVSTMVPVSP